jgi:hypothetical protein
MNTTSADRGFPELHKSGDLTSDFVSRFFSKIIPLSSLRLRLRVDGTCTYILDETIYQIERCKRANYPAAARWHSAIRDS